jgi:hypothetical protein
MKRIISTLIVLICITANAQTAQQRFELFQEVDESQTKYKSALKVNILVTYNTENRTMSFVDPNGQKLIFKIKSVEPGKGKISYKALNPNGEDCLIEWYSEQKIGIMEIKYSEELKFKLTTKLN